MERSIKLVLVMAVISILVSSEPVEAWYKQVASPSYYSVGRASGLLSGIRRSPYIKRDESELNDNRYSTVNSALPYTSGRQNSVLKTMPICLKDITPNLQSCELSLDGTGYFQCKANVLVSLDSSDCVDT